jgi:hypothetical protein
LVEKVRIRKQLVKKEREKERKKNVSEKLYRSLLYGNSSWNNFFFGNEPVWI